MIDNEVKFNEMKSYRNDTQSKAEKKVRTEKLSENKQNKQIRKSKEDKEKLKKKEKKKFNLPEDLKLF